MGFFAIVDPRRGEAFNEPSTVRFSVAKLDINVWLLPLLLGRHTIFCDFGVRITAESPLACFDVAVPFQTNDSSLTDLRSALRDKEVAALVFGEVIPDSGHDLSGSKSPAPERTDFEVCREISVASSYRIERLSNRNFSLWRIHLPQRLEAGEEAYFRFRFVADSFGRTVVWRRTALRRVGVLVDLHFYDPREAALVPEGRRYDDALIEAERLNAFFIVLASLRMRKTSPELRYLRLLEGRKWERYLGRATDLRRRGKFLVHYWRSPDSVGVGDEFRAFLDLGRRTETLGWATGAALVAALATVVVLTQDQSALESSLAVTLLQSVWSGLSGFVGRQAALLGASGAVLAILALVDIFSKVRPLRNGIINRYRRAERALYSKLTDS